MRYHYLLPLAALGSALVLPDEQVFSDLTVQSRHKAESVLDHFYSTKDKAVQYLTSSFGHEVRTADQLFDDDVSMYEEDNDLLITSFEDESVTARALLQQLTEANLDVSDDEHPHPPRKGDYQGPPPPKGPPHGPPPPKHGPPPPKGMPHGPPPPKGPHHGPPGHGKRPHHPPHHHKPNQTIYELISKSKYTTKLAKLISEYDDLVKLLNSTKANHTVFAPTDYAFSKIPEHAPKPSKEFLKKILTYHVAPGLFPAGRVLYDKTVPSLLEVKTLGGPQRIAARLGLKGVTLNFYSRVIAVNIPATNGIIHGIDSILLPPPSVGKILSLVPSEFSTLLYAIEKTNLKNESLGPHVGSTVFAPTNGAFRRLGPRINAFLFSSAGTKYLRALILYHAGFNQTIYSTAYYNGTSEEATSFSKILKRKGCHHKEKHVDAEAYPYVHFDLPTLLYGRKLAIDIGRYGPFVEVKINAFNRVTVADGVARDGVIHLPERVLIPPKQLSEPSALSHWTGEELTVEDLKERLEPFLADDKYLVDSNVEL